MSETLGLDAKKMSWWQRFKWNMCESHKEHLPDVWEKSTRPEGDEIARQFRIMPENWWDYAPKANKDALPMDPRYICRAVYAEPRRCTTNWMFPGGYDIRGYIVTAYYAKDGEG